MSNQIKNSGSIVVGSFSSDPISAQNGEMYYNTTSNVFRIYVNGSWDNVATVAGSGANNSLSNLIATSINQNLVADSNLFRDLGNTSNLWRNLYANVLKTSSDTDFLNIASATFYDGSAVPVANIYSRTFHDNTGTTALDYSNPLEISINSRKISNAADPTLAQDVATKAYVDSLVNGLAWKAPVQLATTGNITLSGEQLIDGFTTATSRVLVKDQTLPEENGIYLSDAGAWTRTVDANSTLELQSAAVFVSEGTVNADKAWVQTGDNVIIGTDPITWLQFTGLSLGANTSLSNLVTTSINQSLFPDTTNSYTVGSSSLRWSEGYFNSRVATTELRTADGANQVLDTANRTIYDSVGGISIDFGSTTSVSFNSKLLSSVADPISIQDAATKNYVDNLVAGLSSAWKSPVVVATTANITLSGEQTIDGILTSASRVLVKNQSTQSQNGIYVSDAGAWTRSTDADSSSELQSAAVFVSQGSTQADTAWVQTTDNVTVGSSNIVWTQFSATASSFANRTLSNLTAPTSINANLLPDTDNNRDLGTATLRWQSVTSRILNVGDGTTIVARLINQPTGVPSGATLDAGIVTNQNGTTNKNLGIFTNNDGSSGTNQTGNLYLETGNKTNGTANSGDIQLRIGTATGTRGKFRIIDGSEGTAGYVWTSTDTSGSGAWMPASGGSNNYWKAPVRVATLVNGALATAYENGDTIDGVTLATGDRILIKNQTTASENGIYTVNASGAPTRATDADSGAELEGAFVPVISGTQGASVWRVSTTGTITLGVTSISFAAFPTKIAVNLDPVTDNSFSIGGGSAMLANIYSHQHRVGLRGNVLVTTSPSGRSNFVTLRGDITGTTPTDEAVGIMSTNNGTNNAQQTTDVVIETGNKTAGTGDSGKIFLRSGTSVGGQRGSIHMVEKSIGAASVGYVWTLQNTSTGEGAWAATSSGANTSLSNLSTTAINAGLTFDMFDPYITTQYQPGPATNSQPLLIATGDADDGDSGDIELRPGAASGTRGKLKFVDGSEGTAGYVWTSTDTEGRGVWSSLTTTDTVNITSVEGSAGSMATTGSADFRFSKIGKQVMMHLLSNLVVSSGNNTSTGGNYIPGAIPSSYRVSGASAIKCFGIDAITGDMVGLELDLNAGDIYLFTLTGGVQGDWTIGTQITYYPLTTCWTLN